MLATLFLLGSVSSRAQVHLDEWCSHRPDGGMSHFVFHRGIIPATGFIDLTFDIEAGQPVSIDVRWTNALTGANQIQYTDPTGTAAGTPLPSFSNLGFGYQALDVTAPSAAGQGSLRVLGQMGNVFEATISLNAVFSRPVVGTPQAVDSHFLSYGGGVDQLMMRQPFEVLPGYGPAPISYAFNAVAGELYSVRMHLDFPNPNGMDTVTLSDAGGTVLASATPLLDRTYAIQSWVAPATGTYHVHYNDSNHNAAHHLVLTRGGEHDIEFNDTMATAIDISNSGRGVGRLAVKPRLFTSNIAGIYEVDAYTGDLMNTLTNVAAYGLTFDGTHLYSLQYQQAPTGISKIDPDTGVVLSFHPLTLTPRSGLTVMGTNLYLLANEAHPDGNLYRTDLSLSTPWVAGAPPKTVNFDLGSLSVFDEIFTNRGGIFIIKYDMVLGHYDERDFRTISGANDFTSYGISGWRQDLYFSNSFSSRPRNISVHDRNGYQIRKMAWPSNLGLFPRGAAIGPGNRPEEDWYVVQAKAGDTLIIDVDLPWHAAGAVNSDLDIGVEVFAGGALVTSNTLAGPLTVPVTANGPVHIRAVNEALTEGEYILLVDGNSCPKPFCVSSTFPASNANVLVSQLPIELGFNNSLDVSSLGAGDVIVNGVPMAQSDLSWNASNALVLVSPPASALTNCYGAVSVEVPGAALVDISGTTNKPHFYNFTLRVPPDLEMSEFPSTPTRYGCRPFVKHLRLYNRSGGPITNPVFELVHQPDEAFLGTTTNVSCTASSNHLYCVYNGVINYLAAPTMTFDFRAGCYTTGPIQSQVSMQYRPILTCPVGWTTDIDNIQRGTPVSISGPAGPIPPRYCSPTTAPMPASTFVQVTGDLCSQPTFTAVDVPILSNGTCLTNYQRTVTVTLPSNACDAATFTTTFTYSNLYSPPLMAVCPSPTSLVLECGIDVIPTDLAGFSSNVTGGCGTAFTPIFHSVTTNTVGLNQELVYTATDTRCNQSVSCTQLIIWVDNTPPQWTPAPPRVESCLSDALVLTPAPIPLDACVGTNLIVTSTDSYVGTACSGSLTRVWQAMEWNPFQRNPSSYTQTILVVDNLAPTFTRPVDVTLACGSSVLPAATGMPGNLLDACGNNPSAGYSDTFTAGCGAAGVITRTWTVVDSCGNATSEVQTITVVDTAPPDYAAPPNIGISCAASRLPANTGWPAPNNVDCSAIASTQFTDVVIAAGPCPAEVFERRWSVADTCGNVWQGTQTITVVDATPPAATFPGNATIPCTSPGTPVVTGSPSGLSDACSGGVSVGYTDTTNTTCGAVIQRLWTVADACGNATSAVQTITLTDSIAPTFLPPPDLSLACGVSTNPATAGSPAAVSDCSSFSVTYSDMVGPDPTCSGSLIARTWTLTDVCGNTTSHLQQIWVDDVAPDYSAPAAATILCNDPRSPAVLGWPVRNAPDCSGVASTSFVDNIVFAGPCPQQLVDRVWSVTDGCGNLWSGTQTISVLGSQPLALTPPADVTLACGSSVSPGNTGSPTGAVNACTANPALSYLDTTNVNCGADMVIERLWSAVDSCSNQTFFTQTITLVDNAAHWNSGRRRGLLRPHHQFHRRGRSRMHRFLSDPTHLGARRCLWQREFARANHHRRRHHAAEFHHAARSLPRLRIVDASGEHGPTRCVDRRLQLRQREFCRFVCAGLRRCGNHHAHLDGGRRLRQRHLHRANDHRVGRPRPDVRAAAGLERSLWRLHQCHRHRGAARHRRLRFGERLLCRCGRCRVRMHWRRDPAPLDLGGRLREQHQPSAAGVVRRHAAGCQCARRRDDFLRRVPASRRHRLALVEHARLQRHRRHPVYRRGDSARTMPDGSGRTSLVRVRYLRESVAGHPDDHGRGHHASSDGSAFRCHPSLRFDTGSKHHGMAGRHGGQLQREPDGVLQRHDQPELRCLAGGVPGLDRRGRLRQSDLRHPDYQPPGCDRPNLHRSSVNDDRLHEFRNACFYRNSRRQFRLLVDHHEFRRHRDCWMWHRPNDCQSLDAD